MGGSTITAQKSEVDGRHPSVAVVILNWNRWPLTLTCLESVFGLSYPDFMVVVCDNASSDDSQERIRAWARGEESAPQPPSLPGLAEGHRVVSRPHAFTELTRLQADGPEPPPAAPLTLIQTGDNLGFAGGCNVGMRYALSQGADHVWLLNNDTVVHPESLTRLVEEVTVHPEIGLCGSTVLHLEDPGKVLALGGGRLRKATGHVWNIGSGRPWPLPENEAEALSGQPLDYVLGASMLATRACLETAGLMDEGYFLYFEELDWAARLPRGMRLGYAPESLVYHWEGGTTGGLRLEWFYRSLLRFTRLHHPALLPLVAARLALRIPEAILTRNWRLLRALISLRRPWSERGLASRADA